MYNNCIKEDNVMMKKKTFISCFSILILAFICIGTFTMFKKTFAMQLDMATSSNSTEAYMNYKEFNFFEKLEDSKDYEEIEKLKYDMLEEANRLYELGDIHDKMKLEDIDFGKAVKIYMGNTINVSDFQDSRALFEKLSTQDYIWELPVKVNNSFLTFTFNIGKPVDESTVDLLSDSDIDIINSRIGHWFLLRVSWNNLDTIDYRSYVNDILQKNNLLDRNKMFVLVGGIEPVYQPILLEVGDKVDSVIIPCGDTMSALSMLRNGTNNSGFRARSIKESGVLSLDEFEDVIKQK